MSLALDQLSRQKNATNRHGEDVRDTLEWLDHATSKYPHIVTLQGAEETFSKWSEVEKFATPRGLFSETDHVELEHEEEQSSSIAEEVVAPKLEIAANSGKGSMSSMATDRSLSPIANSTGSLPANNDTLSPPTSPMKALEVNEKPTIEGTGASAISQNSSVPVRLQPLLNYILWRIHQELDPVAALETFIFLCNDPAKSQAAKGFEVRFKRLEQLREAIGREDREFKNKVSLFNKENAVETPMANVTTTTKSPPVAPAAMIGPQTNVIDPDAFGRSIQPPKPVNGTAQSPRNAFASLARADMNRGNFRGNNTRGRGGFNGAKAPAAANTSPGFGAGSRRRGPAATQMDSQIDPNSFERPRGGFAGRGGRKLWVPT